VSLSDELVARIASLEAQVEELQSRERPLVDRGWRDDFLGRAIHEQYDTTDVAGVDSGITLMDGMHGAWVRLRGGAAAFRYQALWLGDKADNYDTLSAAYGWTMIGRFYISAITDIITDFGTWNAAANRRITARANTVLGVNWYLICQDGGGTTIIDSGVATDTDPHVHRVDAYPIGGGDYQVDWFLDGGLIVTNIANVPADVLTPIVRCQSNGGATRDLYLDHWEVIPKNLA